VKGAFYLAAPMVLKALALELLINAILVALLVALVAMICFADLL
jgi:hypothetical protein